MFTLSYKTSGREVVSYKLNYFLLCFFVLIGGLASSLSYADKQLDAEVAIVYEQAFGKKFSKSTKATQKAEKIQDTDLIAFYHQVFDQQASTVRKARKQKVPTVLAPIKHTRKNKAPVIIQKTIINQAVKTKAHSSSVALTQNTDTAALFAKAFGQPMPTTQIKKDNTNDNTNNAENQGYKANNLNALFAKAFGKKAAVSGPSQISVDLRINKTVLGDVTIFSNKQGYLDLVGTKLFLTLLSDVVKDPIFKQVESAIASKERVSIKTLSKLGIMASYNPVELSFDLKIDPKLRKPLILSLQAKKKASVRKENKIDASKTSGYLNMYSNLNLSSSTNKPDLNMKFEGSFSVGKTVFESTLDSRDGKFTSSNTRLTYDRPRKLQRFMLGNISTGSRNFQENLKLDGFRMSKEFFMDPELKIRPKANESFVLDSDSEVEVYINNMLRQRFYLSAGIYSLEDIGLYDGANNIRVRIKDEFGKVVEKSSQQFYDSHLLKKGLSLYAISVGYLSNKQVGAANKLIKDPVLSAYFQKGLSKNLTIGLDSQISSNSYLLGTEFITSIPLGSIKGGFAASGGSDKQSGYATKFEFRPNQKQKKISLDTLRRQDSFYEQNTITKRFVKGWTASGELRSRDFSLLNSSDSINIKTGKRKKKLKANLQGNFGFNFKNDWRGTLNLGMTDYYEADKSLSANLTAIKRFNNGVRLNIGTHYDTEDDFSVSLQLSVPLFKEKGKRKKSLDFLANSKDNSFESKLSIKPTSLIGKNSLRGSLKHIQNDTSSQQNFEMYYRHTNFETRMNALNNSKQNDSSSQHLNIGFNSGFACVGTKCATSTPITDSFALVSGPSNQETPIAINNGNSWFKYSDNNNTGLPDNYSALIPNKKSKAVIDLESYRYQTINIDESTLPNGYDSEKTEFEVFPRYHQGFLIKAGGEPATILNGILVDEDNKPLGYKGGQWIPIDSNNDQGNSKGKTIAFFSNKAGRFRITSIPAGKYKLELFDYPDMQTIHILVPNLKGKVHDVGNLRIVE